jgi:cytosine/adenosine deaminase-related metal-dependent hydrolase
VSSHDLYGWRGLNLQVARLRVEAALGVTLELHDSIYRGGDYYRTGPKFGESFILQTNRELEELMEPSFPEHDVLLYVDLAEEPTAIEACLKPTGAELLRRRPQVT